MDTVLYIAIAMILIGGAILFIVNFCKAGQAQQMQMISEWLLLAVVQAEKELGGKTGEIKLRYVYDKFLQRFNKVANFITFEQFSKMVDVALERMRVLLSSNAVIAHYVKGDEE